MFLVFRRACIETIKQLDWHHKWVWIAAACFIPPGAWFYLWIFGQGKAVFAEMNLAAATLASIFTIACIVLLINFCRAPGLVIREKDEEILNLKNDITSLQERIHSRLTITHRANTDPWLQVQQAQNPSHDFADAGYLYTYRVSISNIGMETIRNLRVTIAGLLPAELRGMPHHLHYMNDNTQPHTQTRDLPMTLNEINGQFVDVIAYWRGGDGRQIMSIQHITPGIEHSVRVQSYEFTLFVTSDNGGEGLQQRCRFVPQVDAAPILEFI